MQTMVKNRGNALDSFIGDLIQIPRAYYYLLCRPFEWNCINIEKEDDVSVIDDNENVVIAEQIKDKANNNIYDDKSKDLWNTIYNWVWDWSQGASNFTSETKFILYSRQKGYQKGNIVSKMNNAKLPQDIEEAYEYLKNNYPNLKSIKKYKDVILSQENKNIMLSIIRNFECKEPNVSLGTDIENEIKKSYLHYWGQNYEENNNAIFRWFFEKAYDEDTKKRKQLKYNSNDFGGFLNKLYKFDDIIELAFEDDILSHRKEQVQESNFVKQLKLINRKQSSIYKDIRDFLVWESTRDKEFTKGRIDVDSLKKTHEIIHSKWEDIAEEVCNDYKHLDETSIGHKIYTETLKKKFKIGHFTVPDRDDIEFTRGICNYLADLNPKIDSDIVIWWHTNYLNYLEEDNCG